MQTTNATVTPVDTCTCGNAQPHRVAWRRTADGAHVELWDDGALTGAGGLAFPGVPVARPRTDEARRQALAAGRLVAGELARPTEDPSAALYDAGELPTLYATARRLVARDLGATPGGLRAAFAEAEERAALARFPVRWETIAAGCRVGHLPRIRWPGLAVWHERGVYEVMMVQRVAVVGVRTSEALVPTGFRFGTMRDLVRHLATEQGGRS